MEKDLQRAGGKLNNAGFLAKAPEDVIAKERAKYEELSGKIEAVKKPYGIFGRIKVKLNKGLKRHGSFWPCRFAYINITGRTAMNYNESLAYLDSLGKFGIKLGMERIEALLK